MLHDIKFICSFCKQPVTDLSINKDHMAVCLNGKDWTNNLTINLEGPHICMVCVETIIEVKSDMKPTISTVRR